MVAVNDSMAQAKVSSWRLCFSLEMAIACFISYWVMTNILAPLVAVPDAFLGGMWATIATVFVFRPTRAEALSAGISRLSATCISFSLCLAYLLVLPFHPAGLAALLGLGTLIMMLLGRQNDIVTTGITTAVVMVVAAMGPSDLAWRQPLLRLADTVVGIGVGVACQRIGSHLYYRCVGQPAALIVPTSVDQARASNPGKVAQ